MDTRTAIALLSAGRIVIGAGLLGATRRTASGWVGRGTTTIPGGRVAIRAIGGRDVGIGAGTLAALAADAPDEELTRWLLVATAGDVVDGVATVASGRRSGAAMASAGLAFGAAIAGIALAVALKRD
jgi:hypothetical protein